jgi:hypothetical protein
MWSGAFFFMHFGMGKVVGRLEVKEPKIWGTEDSDSTREEEGGLGACAG